jgi:hypothetical protein
MPINRAMIAITTNSSTSVNPFLFIVVPFRSGEIGGTDQAGGLSGNGNR